MNIHNHSEYLLLLLKIFIGEDWYLQVQEGIVKDAWRDIACLSSVTQSVNKSTFYYYQFLHLRHTKKTIIYTRGPYF